MLFVSYRTSAPVWVLRRVRKCLANELDERDQKEETDEKDSLDMVHHVIFEGNKHVIYGLLSASATGKKKQDGETHPDYPLKEVFRMFGLGRTICDALES